MKKIAIISPAPIKGSGGLKRIFTYASVLSNSQYTCDVYVIGAAEKVIKEIGEYYGVSNINVYAEIDNRKKYDLAVATMWTTAIQVRDMNAINKGYLVQDFEACFNTLGDGYLLAEESYMYGLRPFVYGRWLANKLNSDFGNIPKFADFGTDLKVFKPAYANRPYTNECKKSVCFILQPEKPRRCHIIGLNALRLVKHFEPDVEINLVGSDTLEVNDFACNNLGVMSSIQLNDLYNNSTVGFCISSSNPSCNAFDMMAAGLPCVELYRDNNLYDMPDGGVVLAHQSALSMAAAIIDLLRNDIKRKQMSEFGIQFMKNRGFEREQVAFVSYVDAILNNEVYTFNPNQVMYKNPPLIERSELNSNVEQMYKNKGVEFTEDYIIDLIGAECLPILKKENNLLKRALRKMKKNFVRLVG